MPSFVRLLIAPALVGGLVASSHDADASCIPGFDYAAFGKNSVVWGGGATSDSYSSAGGSGQYSTTHQDADGNIGTNGDQCDVVNFNGTAGGVQGNVEYGTSGTSCAVDGGNYTGSAYPQGTEPAFPSVVAPSTPSCAGATSVSNPADGTIIPTNTCYTSVDTKNQLVAQAGTYVMQNFSTTAGGELKVGSGPITIYITCSGSNKTGIDMKGGSVSNTSQISTNLIFMVAPACTDITITGGTGASYAVYAPDSNVKITGNSDLYGAVVGKTIDATGGAKIHYDKALKTAPAGAFTCTTSEISRAAPVSATLGGTSYVIQGTYEYPFATYQTLTPTNASTWQFQFIHGHLRKRDVTDISTTASGFTSTFDMTIPTRSYTGTGCTATNGSCRRIYTNTNSTPASGVTWQTNLNILQFNDNNADAIGALIVKGLKSTFTWSSANYKSIVHAVLDASLGGVDRSTVAVIGASTLAGRSDRPTIAYFGATDGMLHAVCMTTGKDASGNSVCSTVGAELWAFMPRVQLPLVGSNGTRLDGSVHVVDAYGDFTNQTMTGTKSYKTILVFQTGYSNALTKPAAYAVNVTDPANPVFLWEYTTPSSPSSIDFGVGVTSTPGVAMISSKATNFVAFATNNGGNGTVSTEPMSALYVTSRQLETGAQLWSSNFTQQYSSTAVPDTGVPGGLVAVDLTGNGTTTDLLGGDIEGRLWRIKATDGTNANGSNPLFKFSTTKHPIGAKPAIFSNGSTLYAAFTSGGYIDHSGATSWSDTTQYVIAVKVSANASTSAITEANAGTVCSTCNLAIKQSFTGSNGFSQVSIVGTRLEVLTDTSDVNAANYGTTANTGRAFAFDLGASNPTGTMTTVASGGTSMTVVKLSGGATLVGSNGTKQQVVASGVGTSGTSVDYSNVLATITRRLWLRME